MSLALLQLAPAAWERTTLGDVVERGGGSIQTGPFGSQLHASDYVPVGVPSIMPVNIGDNRLIHQGIARISQQDAERLSRHIVRKGDIIYSRRGDLERRALIRDEEDGWFCGTGCVKVRLGDGVVYPEFASYYLGHPEVREWIVRHAVGATMPNLNTAIMSAIPLLVPPPYEQRAIAHILGTLDDKIELNRRMNETLEAIARAIFKSWFVDFDPVRAKMEGRQPAGLDTATAALFPDSFEDSPLGKIPKGWHVASVESVATVVKGRSYKSAELDESTIALVTLKSIARGGGYRPEGLKPYTGAFKAEQVIRPGELVVAYTDVTQAAEVIGKPAIVRADDRFDTFVASLDLSIIRAVSDYIGVPFLYLLFGTDDFQAHAYGHTNGTTVLHLDRTAVPSYEFPLPPSGLLRRFDSLASPAFRKVDENEQESRTLAAIRDALLPKLLSGEIRVKDAEKVVEEVT